MQPPDGYQDSVNQVLLERIPSTARTILEVGCGDGSLGEMIKTRHPDVVYYGIEADLELAKIAMNRLNYVFCGHMESNTFELGTVTFDCILLGDMLNRFHHPLTILKRLQPLLNPDGHLLCSVYNFQHHTVLASLISGDFQYHHTGILNKDYIRFYTYASFFKLLLDAGFMPNIAQALVNPHSTPDPQFLEAIHQGMTSLGNNPGRCASYVNIYMYIMDSTVNQEYVAPRPPPFPISFIVPVNNPRVLKNNLLSSPLFQTPHPHQIITLENQGSAAQAIENGIQQAEHDFIVYAHQDVYLPNQFDAIFCQNVLRAKARFTNAGLFGIYGFNHQENKVIHHGSGSGQHTSGRVGGPLPIQVESLEEALFGFYKSDFPGMNPDLGWHMYGVDIVCAFREQGQCAVVIEAPIYHNTTVSGLVPPEFITSLKQFWHSKWRKYLPIATHTVIIPVEGMPFIPFGESVVMQQEIRQ